MIIHFIRASATRAILLISVIFVGAVVLQASTLVDYNFDSLTTGALTGQDGWVTVGVRSSSTVIAGPSGSLDTSMTAGNTPAAGTTPVMNKNSTLFSAGSVTSNSILTLTVDIYAGSSAANSLFGIGASLYSGSGPSALFGIWGDKFYIRAENFGAETYAKNSSGLSIGATVGDWYRIKSVWDLSTGQATLSIMDLTLGETTYTALYFDSAQTDGSADLGISSTISSWDTIYLRTGTAESYIDNLSVSVVPEPQTAALLILSLATLVLCQRMNSGKSFKRGITKV